jgi:hypothetical protein
VGHQCTNDAGQGLLCRGVGVKAHRVGVEWGGQQGVANDGVAGDARGAPLAAYLPWNVFAPEDSEPVANGDVLKVAVELLGLAGGRAQDHPIAIGVQVVRVLEVLDVAVDRYQDTEVIGDDARVEFHRLVPF